MGDSILSRVSASTADPSALTPLQATVHAGISSAQTQLIDPYNIASWLIGAAAYGLVRKTGIRVGEEIAIRRSDFYARGVLIGLRRQDSYLVTRMTSFYDKPFTTLPSLMSIPVGMAAGSGAQVLSRRTLLHWADKGAENPHHWNWSGKGGIKDEFLQSLFNYGGGLVGAEATFRGGAFVFRSDLSASGKLGLAFLLTSASTGAYYGFNELGRLLGYVDPEYVPRQDSCEGKENQKFSILEDVRRNGFSKIDLVIRDEKDRQAANEYIRESNVRDAEVRIVVDPEVEVNNFILDANHPQILFDPHQGKGYFYPCRPDGRIPVIGYGP